VATYCLLAIRKILLYEAHLPVLLLYECMTTLHSATWHSYTVLSLQNTTFIDAGGSCSSTYKYRCSLLLQYRTACCNAATCTHVTALCNTTFDSNRRPTHRQYSQLTERHIMPLFRCSCCYSSTTNYCTTDWQHTIQQLLAAAKLIHCIV
jgi:hypothetical protein